MTFRRTPPLVAAAILLALCACAPEPTPDLDPSTASAPTTTADAEPAATPTAAPFAVPTEDVAGQVAFSVIDTTGDVPETVNEAGPGALVADRTMFVEGACEGGSLSYEVRTTNPDDAGRMLIGSTIECGRTPPTTNAWTGPYAGTVQIVITDADDVDRGWVRATQP